MYPWGTYKVNSGNLPGPMETCQRQPPSCHDGLLLKDTKVGTFHRFGVPDRALSLRRPGGKLRQKFINRVIWYSKWSREAGMVCQQRSLTLRKVSPSSRWVVFGDIHWPGSAQGRSGPVRSPVISGVAGSRQGAKEAASKSSV